MDKLQYKLEKQKMAWEKQQAALKTLERGLDAAVQLMKNPMIGIPVGVVGIQAMYNAKFFDPDGDHAEGGKNASRLVDVLLISGVATAMAGSLKVGA